MNLIQILCDPPGNYSLSNEFVSPSPIPLTFNHLFSSSFFEPIQAGPLDLLLQISLPSFWESIACLTFITLGIVNGIWIYVQYRQKQRREAEHSLIDQKLESRADAIQQSIQWGEESRRKELAMDIHDSVGGMLSTLFQRFDMLKERHEIQDDQYDHSLELIHETLQKVRTVTRPMFAGSISPVGLVDAVRTLADFISEFSDLHVQVHSHDLTPDTLPEYVRTDVLRLVQSAMSNTLKFGHANQAEIILTLRKKDHELSILIEDDGVGFKPNLTSANPDLKRFKDRIDRLSGALIVDSNHGKGTRLSINIPLEDYYSTLAQPLPDKPE
ncbi:histidine kinase [Pontibacter sp. G13]|uniref:sensor histidine kinase n=1 Tax=Pontibacter sp. G13 TaxID=3074898 RepID=UPI00288ADCF6|nr:hypothetical protein [Pontibacter sp. G13]WNJ20461.1 hypothetical protein RJD25_08265 [Pontibacter sp. G13]